MTLDYLEFEVFRFVEGGFSLQYFGFLNPLLVFENSGEGA